MDELIKEMFIMDFIVHLIIQFIILIILHHIHMFDYKLNDRNSIRIGVFGEITSPKC